MVKKNDTIVVNGNLRERESRQLTQGVVINRIFVYTNLSDCITLDKAEQHNWKKGSNDSF